MSAPSETATDATLPAFMDDLPAYTTIDQLAEQKQSRLRMLCELPALMGKRCGPCQEDPLVPHINKVHHYTGKGLEHHQRTAYHSIRYQLYRWLHVQEGDFSMPAAWQSVEPKPNAGEYGEKALICNWCDFGKKQNESGPIKILNHIWRSHLDRVPQELRPGLQEAGTPGQEKNQVERAKRAKEREDQRFKAAVNQQAGAASHHAHKFIQFAPTVPALLSDVNTIIASQLEQFIVDTDELDHDFQGLEEEDVEEGLSYLDSPISPIPPPFEQL